MRALDLRQVEVFYYVAKFRSFSKAAEALLLTQPTISGHIKTLEESLALVLFDRLGREVTLTQAGEVLYSYAKRLLSVKTAAVQALQDQWLVSQQLLGNEPNNLRVLPDVASWQIYLFRGNSWSNAQSSGDVAASPDPAARSSGTARGRRRG